jgi:hypothetical protein
VRGRDGRCGVGDDEGAAGGVEDRPQRFGQGEPGLPGEVLVAQQECERAAAEGEGDVLDERARTPGQVGDDEESVQRAAHDKGAYPDR